MSANVVRKLAAAEGARLEQELVRAGFEMGGAPHAVFTARGPGVTVVFYRSVVRRARGEGPADVPAPSPGGA